MNDLITKHLDIWTTAIAGKATAGRGNKSPSPAGEGRGEGNTNNTRNTKYTAYGIKKLRELILELAVRGKLVSQDPNDEPASELLKRIADEKAWLVKEGKISKQPSLESIDINHEQFKLPKNWKWERLGNYVYLEMGQSPSSSFYNQEGNGIPFFQGKADFGDLFPTPRYWCTQPQKYSYDGDILLSVRAPVGPTNIANINCCIGRGLAALRPLALSSTKFLLILMRAFQRNLEMAATGTTFVAVSKKDVESLIIAIPPLAEQHRIVAKVDELMALCEQLEQQQTDSIAAHQTLVQTLLDTLTQAADAAEFEQAWSRIADHFDTLFTTEASIDQLKQTLMQLAVMGKLVPQNSNDEPAVMLLEEIADKKSKLINKKEKPLLKVTKMEKPYEIPETWEWERIGTVALSTDYGLSEKTFEDRCGIPVLKMGDIIDGKIVLGGQKTVSSDTQGLPDLLLEDGDLLYNRTNSAELVGKTGVYLGTAGIYTFASYLIRIRFSKELIVPRFINICMNSILFRKTQIEPHLKQQCGQANVNGTIMRNMLVPIPPLAEQHRIVAKVDELMTLCDTLKARIIAAQTTQLQLADAIVEQAVA